MKKIFTLTLFFTMAFGTGSSFARSGPCELNGKVVNAKKEAVEFATVVLTTGDTVEVAGVMANGDGVFKIIVPEGEYIMTVQCLGYEPNVSKLTVKENKELEPITLSEKSEQLGEVVVKAPTIVREADRFVMTVAGTNAAIGKNAFEMLRSGSLDRYGR